MSKQSENPIVLNLPDMYTQLRGKIIDGSISLEETNQLYNEFAKITPAEARAKVIEAMNKDLHTEISSEKFHSFASKLVEVEKQIVTEAHPIKDTDSPEQRKAGMQKRCAEYMRNTSLTKNVVLYECTKNEFAKEISESLLKGDKEGTKKHLANLKIPDYLQEHYSSITQFYKENGNEKGAMTNLVFHIISTSVTQYGKATIPPGPEYNNFVKSLDTVSKEVYSPKIPGSYNKLGSQIPGYTLETVAAEVEVSAKSAPEKSNPTFMDRVGSAISSFVNKIKGLVGIKEKSATPEPQNIQTSVTTHIVPKDPKQQSVAPEKIVTTAIEGPTSRPRSNAVSEAASLRKGLKPLSAASTTTYPPNKVKGKSSDTSRVR
jgi:hypothetical protein